MIVLPLSVLFHEGPIARAYLAHLARAGCQVSRIIQMIPPPGPVAKFLWRDFRSALSASNQNAAAHFWPRRLARTYPGTYRNIIEGVGRAFDIDETFFEEIRSRDGLEKYSPSIARVEVDGIKDPQLVELLAAEKTTELLFTGGGIVPKALFNIAGLRILHVHPGRLPDVRGADGLLWSMLTRGRPGASCFLMKPGLDEGDLVDVQEFSPLAFAIPDDENPDKQALYRMVFSYIDPVLRAHTFTSVIRRFSDPKTIEGIAQDLTAGVTYHFLEGRLRDIALSKIFKRG